MRVGRREVSGKGREGRGVEGGRGESGQEGVRGRWLVVA